MYGTNNCIEIILTDNGALAIYNDSWTEDECYILTDLSVYASPFDEGPLSLGDRVRTSSCVDADFRWSENISSWFQLATREEVLDHALSQVQMNDYDWTIGNDFSYITGTDNSDVPRNCDSFASDLLSLGLGTDRYH